MSLIHPQFGVGPQVSESLDGVGSKARTVKGKVRNPDKTRPS